MSSSIRSNASRRNICSATRPFSPVETLWPISSRLRVSSSRFTLLSSTMRSRAPPWFASRTLELRQRLSHPRIFAGQSRERLASVVSGRTESAQLQLARHRGERRCAEGVAVGLQRMRCTAKTIRIVGVQRTAQLCEHAWRFGEKGVDELAHEVGAGGELQLFVDRAIDGSFSHVSGPFAVGP